MKFIVLCGGALGFFTAGATDFWSGRGPDRILLDGALGCLAGALLLKWFWGVVLTCVRATHLARHRAALSAAAATATAAAATLPPPPAKSKS